MNGKESKQQKASYTRLAFLFICKVESDSVAKFFRNKKIT